MASFAKFGNDLYTGARSINFVGRRRIWYSIAAVMVLLSVVIPIARGGFVLGIEFRGGSEFQVAGVPDLDQEAARTEAQDVARDAVLSVVADGSPRVSIVGADSVRVQTEQLESRRLLT